MNVKRGYILTAFILFTQASFAQYKNVPVINERYRFATLSAIYKVSDTASFTASHKNYILLGIKQNVCRNKTFIYGLYNDTITGVSFTGNSKGNTDSYNDRSLNATVHGSVMYEGLYQSNLDTPFIQKNIYQQSVAATLDITVKHQYPLRLFFTARQSNVPFLKNMAAVTLQLNNSEFKNNITAQLQQQAIQQLPINATLGMLKEQLTANTAALAVNDSLAAALKHTYTNTLAHVNNIQPAYNRHGHFSPEDIVHLMRMARGAKYITAGTKNADANAIRYKYLQALKQVQLIHRHIDSLQKAYFAGKKKLAVEADSISASVPPGSTPGRLIAIAKNLGIPDSLLPKGYKALLSLSSAGIGRNTISFSELSIKNIAITGIEAEYNPGAYLAVGAGTVDYRYRDYVIQQPWLQRQYITVVRVGNGLKDGNHIFFTYYAGRRQVYNYAEDNNQVQSQPLSNVMGWSVEGRFQLSKFSYIIAETGKSSLPPYNRQQSKQGMLGSAFNFSNHSNEAWSVSFTSFIPSTKTKMYFLYRHLGANFQSFNIFTTNTSQSAWDVRVTQPFFKKALVVNASLKKNDFTSPYINQQFYTNTIFKSIQATIKIKNLPVFLVGYYPASQLIKLGNSSYSENLFYTLVGMGSYYYRYRTLDMATMVTYTRFYNRAADSNFIYYNTSNIMLAQSFTANRASMQINLSGAKNVSYSFYTAEGGMQYKIAAFLTAGGSVKYIRQTAMVYSQFGCSANATMKINKLGDVQLLWQKGYIPGSAKQLVRDDIGRITYYKTF